MVDTPSSGVFKRFYAEAVESDAVRIVGSEDADGPLFTATISPFSVV
jgi:hypothetical protein